MTPFLLRPGRAENYGLSRRVTRIRNARLRFSRLLSEIRDMPCEFRKLLLYPTELRPLNDLRAV